MTNNSTPEQGIGKKMAIIAWIIGLLLLTQLFGAWETHQQYPNQSPESATTSGKIEVALKQNRSGHYVVNGLINQYPATLMLDTGATDVVIPKSLATKFGLSPQGQGLALTANGYVNIEYTQLNSLQIGDITLYDVRASINPGMQDDQVILLGMSALAQLDMNQSGRTLTLTQYR